MKNKKKLNLVIAILGDGALIGILMAYCFSSKFSDMTNRVIGIIQDKNIKEMLAFFAQQQPYEKVAAFFANLLQTLMVVFDKNTVISACHGYFGTLQGGGILLLSSLLSVVIAYGLGYGIRLLLVEIKPLKRLIEKFPLENKTVEIVFLLLAFNACMLKMAWVGIILYIVGFLEIDFKKVMIVTSIAILLL